MTATLLRGRLLTFLRRPDSIDDAGSYRYESDGGLLVEGGRISSIGAWSDIKAAAPADAEAGDHRVVTAHDLVDHAVGEDVAADHAGAGEVARRRRPNDRRHRVAAGERVTHDVAAAAARRAEHEQVHADRMPRLSPPACGAVSHPASPPPSSRR